MLKTGGCACGAVRYEAEVLPTITYCHCSKCRRWHGHLGAYTASDRDKLTLRESKGLKWHQVSSAVRRGFCQECGSTLFFDESGDGKIGITAGSIDDSTGLRSKAHIFLGSKGHYYEVPEDGLMRLDEGPP